MTWHYHLKQPEVKSSSGYMSMCFLFQKYFCPQTFILQRQENFKSLAAGDSPSALLLPTQELADLPVLPLLASFTLQLPLDTGQRRSEERKGVTEQTWLPAGSLWILPLCKTMLPLAWNMQGSTFSRLCLPGLFFQGLTVFIYIKINSCTTEDHTGPVGGRQQTYKGSCKGKGWSHSPSRSGPHQDSCNN